MRTTNPTRQAKADYFSALMDPDPEARAARVRALQAHYAKLGASGDQPRPGGRRRPLVCVCGCGGEWPTRDAAARALGVNSQALWERAQAGEPVGEGHIVMYADQRDGVAA